MSDKSITDYEQDTISIIHDLTQDWDTGLEGELNAQTSIVADIEFESLDVVHLITAIEQFYDEASFPFEKLLMEDGHYVQDLTVHQIASFVQEHLVAQKS